MSAGDTGQVQTLDGAAAPEPRVVFGDAPGNSLTLEVAATVLRLWHKSDPETMGAYVGEAICGVKPRTAARRNRGQ